MSYAAPVTYEATQTPGDPFHAQVLSPAGAQSVLGAISDAVSTASRHNRQRAVSKESAIATSVLLSRGRRGVPAVLDPEHPLMGPHPTD
jgi:hypothetical protein